MYKKKRVLFSFYRHRVRFLCTLNKTKKTIKCKSYKKIIKYKLVKYNIVLSIKEWASVALLPLRAHLSINDLYQRALDHRHQA